MFEQTRKPLMQSTRYYTDQFSVPPDLLHIMIPQNEVIDRMLAGGEQETLNDICLAVAVVADSITAAQLAA
jgi:hypothetical protein